MAARARPTAIAARASNRRGHCRRRCEDRGRDTGLRASEGSLAVLATAKGSVGKMMATIADVGVSAHGPALSCVHLSSRGEVSVEGAGDRGGCAYREWVPEARRTELGSGSEAPAAE